MLPQASRRANRGVRILIDLPDQSQDNNANVQRGLRSPSQHKFHVLALETRSNGEFINLV